MDRLVAGVIVAAGAVPALAYALAGQWPGALLCAALAAGWLGGRRAGLAWPGAAAFLTLAGAAGFGALSGLPPLLCLLGAVAALAAWDLDAFALRLGAGRLVDADALWRAHLRRLGPALGAGLALGAAALTVRVELSFGWALLLGVVAAVALARAVRAGFER